MWVDSWGNEYSTQEEAIQTVISEYLPKDLLLDGLDYRFTVEELLDFIFADEVVLEKFMYEFGDEVDAEEYDFAMDNIEEIEGDNK